MKHRLLIVTATALVIALCSANPALAWDKVGNFTASGNLGVGTESPAQKLHMYNGGVGSTRFRLENTQGYIDFFANEGGGGFLLNGVVRFYVAPNGFLGLGNTAPVRRLVVGAPGNASNEGIRIQNSEGNADLIVDNGAFTLYTNSASRMSVNANGRIGIGTMSPATLLDVNGEATVNVLNIRGGSDLSEWFEVASADSAAIKPGFVACIDPENPGKLLVSTKPYARTVAGIISGAGDLRPGMTMGQTGSIADGEHPVALTGRVYCYVDATKNPVVPGDLLTTSGTRGHAMKVTDHAKAQGAIIGKAMTGLKEGKGLVLVLVSLQ